MAGKAILKDNSRLYVAEQTSFTAFDADDKIGNISSIGETGSETAEIDSTTLDSEAMEAEPGYETAADLTISVNVTDKAKLNSLRAWQLTGEKLYIGQITDNGATTAPNVIYDEQACAGWIKSLKVNEKSVGALLSATVTFKVSGRIYADSAEVGIPAWATAILGKIPLKGATVAAG